jgi:hypothetical protein
MGSFLITEMGQAASLSNCSISLRLQNGRDKLAACPFPKQGAHYRQAIPGQQKPATIAPTISSLCYPVLPEKLLSNDFTAKNRWSVRKASVYNAPRRKDCHFTAILTSCSSGVSAAYFQRFKNQADSPPNVESFCFLSCLCECS